MSPMTDDREESMRCPTCGHSYPRTYQFCPDDGSDLIAGLPGRLADSRKWMVGLPVAAAAVAVLILALIIGAVVANHKRAAQPAAAVRPGDAADPSEGDGGSGEPVNVTWERYESARLGFQVDHPAGWAMSEPTGTGATEPVLFASPDGRVRILVAVDAEAPRSVTPMARFQAIDRYLRKKHGDGFQMLGSDLRIVAGQPAASWLYTVRQDDGSLVETHDIAIPHAGNGRSYGVLCTAPAADYGRWKDAFDRVIRSFQC